MKKRTLILLFALILGACGGGGGGTSPPAPPPPPPPPPPPTLSANANLETLALTGTDLEPVALDQIFQPTQPDYTAGVGFLVGAVRLNAMSEDSAATVRVNGSPFDAAGLDLSLAQGDNPVEIEVTAEDGVATALYMLTVTRELGAQFAQAAYVKASNTGEGDEFGFSVAFSGDTLAVGATRENSAATGIDGDQGDTTADNAGAVYVYTRDGAGMWSQQAYIKASNTQTNDRFGSSVALSGDTLAVGAVFEASATTGIDGDQSDNSAANAGAVYVYTRDEAGIWSQRAYIKASNTDAADFFGRSVALSGDTLAVGALFENSASIGIDGDQTDDTAENAGAVYVFTRDGAGVWSQQAYVKASNTEADDFFGGSVALSGDTLAVTADAEDSVRTGIDGDETDNTADNAGAAYVYTRDEAGIWSQQAYVKASNTGADDRFGSSVALSGDTLAVGASLEASAATGIDGDQGDNNADEAGAVYVYTRDGANVWSQQAYIKASNTETFDLFGFPLALSGDTLAVGATLEASAATGIDGDQSDNSATNAGAVYLYTRDGAGIWSQQAYVKAPNTDEGDDFAFSLALSGDTVAVGARFEDSGATGIDGDQSDNTADAAGAVYVFE